MTLRFKVFPPNFFSTKKKFSPNFSIRSNFVSTSKKLFDQQFLTHNVFSALIFFALNLLAKNINQNLSPPKFSLTKFSSFRYQFYGCWRIALAFPFPSVQRLHQFSLKNSSIRSAVSSVQGQNISINSWFMTV